MNPNYKELRKKALQWIESKDRDFDAGVKILGEAEFKPVALSNCIRRGKNHKFGRDKLEALMYQYIRLWAKPSMEKEDDAPDDDYQQQPDVDVRKTYEDVEKELVEQGYPKEIRRAIHEFYALSKERNSLHSKASEITGNSEAEIADRNSLFDEVEQKSRRMDVLWKAKEQFENTGKFPEDLFVEKKEVVPPKKIVLPDDVEELKKLKKNTSCKLTRAKNQLLYQQDTKADKENPIPDGPKRAKYLKKIDQLMELTNEIDYKLVQLENAV